MFATIAFLLSMATSPATIGDTVEIVHTVKPVYNFKAS